MKEPFDLLNELSDDSLSEHLTLEEWLEYLLTLHEAVQMKIETAQNDIDNSKKRKK